MFTEQDRLNFEAKHPVPNGAIYIPKNNIYVWAGSELPWQYPRSPSEYNTLWQGYQSALEDRQWEAVGKQWRRFNPLSGWASKWADLPEDFPLEDFQKLAAADGEEIQTRELFTAPQPDQWKQLYEWLNKELNCSGELMSMVEYTHHRINIEFVMKQMESMDSTLIKKGI